ncbi:O-antigen ligase family protein [Halostella salina]|uniref:O-antigen ligase family protein n=1 Tax=Halostella salina TaxID=1547897 RepID=UPI000EF76269|nr:O-antigen ligase family protein [Halostella salina]
MVKIYPSVLVFLPILLVTIGSRKRSILYFLATVPFFGITVIVAISHRFTPPEIAFFGLMFNQLYRWAKGGEAELQWSQSYSWFGVFLIVAAISVAHVAINPAPVEINPYGKYAGNFDWVLLSFQNSNITQLALRIFTVVVIVFTAMNMRIKELPLYLRTLVFGGFLAGLSGILYQLSILTGIQQLVNIGIIFGDMWPAGQGYGFLGPLPRMGTVSGEPGHTAQFLLYLLAVCSTLYLTGSNRVFRDRTLFGVVVALFTLLLLTTSSTGYGGLLVLAAVTAGLGVLTTDFERTRVIRLLGCAIVFGIGLVSVVLVTESSSVVEYVFEKLQFQDGSGSYRARYLVRSVEVWLRRPLFGVGVGSYYPMSLFGTILAETGLLGLISFLGAVTTSSWEAVGFHLNKNLRMPDVTLALVNGAITMIIVSLVAKSITTTLSPWFWIAIALPIAVVQFERREDVSQKIASEGELYDG